MLMTGVSNTTSSTCTNLSQGHRSNTSAALKLNTQGCVRSLRQTHRHVWSPPCAHCVLEGWVQKIAKNDRNHGAQRTTLQLFMLPVSLAVFQLTSAQQGSHGGPLEAVDAGQPTNDRHSSEACVSRGSPHLPWQSAVLHPQFRRLLVRGMLPGNWAQQQESATACTTRDPFKRGRLQSVQGPHVQSHSHRSSCEMPQVLTCRATATGSSAAAEVHAPRNDACTLSATCKVCCIQSARPGCLMLTV
jgi:hypothetical protein